MRFYRGFWLVVPLLLILGGCRETEIIGGKNSPHAYTRVASMSPATTEIMATHSDFNQMVGRTESCNYPPTVGRLPIVTKGVKPDYEMLARVRPNMILMDALLYSDDDIRKVKETTYADVFLLNADKDGKPLQSITIDSFIDWLYRFGATQTDPMRIAKYADSVYQAREVSQATPLNPKPKVAVLMGGTNGESYYIAGTRSFQADAMRAAGGDAVGPDSSKFEVANIEGLIQLNPDAIVTTEDPTAVLKDPRLQGITAVKNGRVAKILADVLLRSGVRVDKLIISVHDYLTSTQKGGQ